MLIDSLSIKSLLKYNPAMNALTKDNNPASPTQKTYDPERAHRTAIKMAASTYDPETAVRAASENLDKYWEADKVGSRARKKKARIEINDNLVNLAGATSLDTHSLLVMGVNKEHRTLVLDYAKRLEKELGECTMTERSLIQTAAAAYGRHFSSAMRLEAVLNMGYVTPNLVAHNAMLSKEIDRSHRQLMASLSALRALRTPPLAITVGSI